MYPAFVGGLPGGMELAIVFMLFVSVGVVALVVVAAGRIAFGSDGGGEDDVRVEKLESQVSELESRVSELQRRLDDGDQG